MVFVNGVGMKEYKNGWKFSDLDTRALDKPNEFLVLADFHIEHGRFKYTVKEGETIDFASIPIGLRSIFNRNGLSRKAAAMHDSMYANKWGNRARADQLFYEALKGLGMSGWKARVYYWGVRLGGWTRGNW
jgi:hypothetical protein